MARDKQDIKLRWGTNIKDTAAGNQFGYYVHNTKLREAVNKIHPLVSDKTAFTDIVYIMSPEYFSKQPAGANTWLFTMFEGTTIPKKYYENMCKANYLLAPSNWVAELFKKYFDIPVFVVNHGVSRQFRFKKRKYPLDRPFRFLWLGAPNPRKGYEEVIVVWNELFKLANNVELYLKTTGPKEWSKHGKVSRNGNVILDGRRLSDKELVELYHSAHCFLFPTRGEGFGLTLAEAMRTGLPCISPHYSGVTDFFNSRVGYIIDHKMGEGKITFIGDDTEEKTEMCFPSPDQLAEKMFYIMENYEEALRLGKRAHLRIKKFTWKRSAYTLLKALKEVNGADG